MPRLVVKNSITAVGALVVGQTLWLGSFIMTSRSAAAPTMTSRVIKNSLHVGSEFVERMDPMELSSLNELLDRITALGVATDCDRIGLKPDQREINSPPITHHITVVEEQCGDSSSILRTNYVRIPELSELDTHLWEDITQALNLESGSGPDLSGNIPKPELPRSETPPPLGLRLGQGSDLNPPTHPDTNYLSHTKKAPQDTVHHYWARFLLVMNKVKDCREEDAISLFCKNCRDKGILNALTRRDIAHFADLAAIVRKYCAMESAWKTQTNFGIIRL